MENVRGLLSAAIKHRPLHLRDDQVNPLTPDEELGSVLNRIILPEFEDRLDYQVSFGVLNSLDYGAAQDRKRLIIVGSRDKELGDLPARPPINELVCPTHFRTGTESIDKWKNLRQGLYRLKDPDPEFQRYSDARAAIFDNVPEGMNWRFFRDDPAFGEEYVRKILGGAYGSTGGRVGFWRRLSWDKWAPTLTTSPTQKSTGLCHPTLTRPLSVKEYARIQGFPDDWEFAGSISAKYRQIGNAVATQVATALGMTIARLVNKEIAMADVEPVGAL
jgi:DNA (cytosine-5)-methyltransferase 1